MDEAAAHGAYFVCPSPGCQVRLFAVIPEKVTRTGRPYACHFRLAAGTSHRGHGDVAVTVDEGKLSTPGTVRAASRRPTTWVDPRIVPEPGDGEPESLGDSLERSARTQRLRTDAEGAAARVSTSQIRTLVDWWRGDQPGIRDARIRMPMSTARTWHGLFVDSRNTADRKGIAEGDRRVFYGPIDLVRRYGHAAVKVSVNGGPANKTLSCYFDFSPEERHAHPELARLLLAAQAGKLGTIYLLGTLMGTKVTIQSLSYVWIALEP